MSSGIDFAGNGSEDLGKSMDSTGGFASRGARGPIEWTGDGASDVGGTIDTGSEDGVMPPSGGGVEFAGDVGQD